ncbi:cobalt-precorrin-5B (C(1))-methyltransferase CbiD [Maridesulfovibrio sp.]|uniref:cobalt-precorrin-5B (C(1))-methyltransferase CbiD n=1 Tax=Maridesulfovibrio sp. TaxID=2795000 RepID=UPI002A18E31F|nr:cobalt-precorrin-5B (C(1))-methyltransferase CbiD [Maridesulfovibrio sp.]
MSARTENLREGFTTGSSATAAAMAALRCLLDGTVLHEVSIPLPVKGTLNIPVERVDISASSARAAVIKDGGDDPDATHGYEIHAVVELHDGRDFSVQVEGGKGVGRVTLPGLPVPVGEAAINPAPRRQIISGILQVLAEFAPGFRGTVSVRIEVPCGEEIAAKTMNSRLGILGGISILGTQGIVRPYSNASWKASIAQSLSVLRAAGYTEAVFTTGRRSERFYLDRFSGTDPVQVVQAADFFRFSMLQARAKRVKRVCWAVFIGKLVKHAQGFPYTHAKDWDVDFMLLSDWCADLGLPPELVLEVRTANTARQVYEMIPEAERSGFIEMLLSKARMNAKAFAGNNLQVEYCVFDFEGNQLNRSPEFGF